MYKSDYIDLCHLYPIIIILVTVVFTLAFSNAEEAGGYRRETKIYQQPNICFTFFCFSCCTFTCTLQLDLHYGASYG